MSTLLEVNQLEITLKTKEGCYFPIQNISFSLSAGKCLGIIGESGSGKSILCKAILGLMPSLIVAGTIYYRDQNLLQLNLRAIEKIRAKEISWISQNAMTGLNPIMTIGKQLIEAYQVSFLSNYSEAYEAACHELELLKLSKISYLMKSYPYMISGGMKQRILIAMALIRRPQILIADEPTTALDEDLKWLVFSRFEEEKIKRNMALLLVSHALDGVKNFCDDVLVLYAGKMVEFGTAVSIFNSAKHPYTQKLIQSIPTLKTDKTKPLPSIPGQPPLLNNKLSFCPFASRCEDTMVICCLQQPPIYTLDHSQKVSCFKYDPRR